MREATIKSRKNIFLVTLLFLTLCYILAYAFDGPSQSGGGGSGALNVSNQGINISIGTSTHSSTLLYIHPKSDFVSNRNLLLIENEGGDPVLNVDYKWDLVYGFVETQVGIGTSTPDLQLVVDGDLQVTGTIYSDYPFLMTGPASNITPGVFDSYCGSPPCSFGASYAFPTGISLAVGTSSNVGIPSTFAVYGNASIVNGNLAVGTTSTQTNLNVNGRIRAAVSSGTTPTSGTGVEMYYLSSQGKSIISSISRSSGNLQPLQIISGNALDLRAGTGTTRVALSGSNILVPRVSIGTTTFSQSDLDINGMMRLIPSYPNGAGLPTLTNGSIHYDSATNKFRCYQASVMLDCIAPMNVVNGSGATNYLARWTSDSDLGTGLGIDDGTTALINGQTILNNGALYVSGTAGTTPASGGNTRMMWIPAKAAFRAGQVTALQWNDGSIGSRSIAFGYNNSASNNYSIALGSNHSVNAEGGFAAGDLNNLGSSAQHSVAFGHNNQIPNTTNGFTAGTLNSVDGIGGVALGFNSAVSNANYGVAMGRSTVGGAYGVALGYLNNAGGNYSTALGANMTVNGANSFGINVSSTAATVTSGNPSIMAIMGGNVGIGLTNPSYTLQVNGTAAKTGGGNWTTPSDARFKNILGVYRDGLSVIDKINPIIFRYNGLAGISSSTEYVGVIAQDIKNIPELAKYSITEYEDYLNPDDSEPTKLLAFNSDVLTYTSINAIKENKKEFDSRLNGISMRDRVTKEKYCLTLNYGEFVTTKGGCLN